MEGVLVRVTAHSFCLYTVPLHFVLVCFLFAFLFFLCSGSYKIQSLSVRKMATSSCTVFILSLFLFVPLFRLPSTILLFTWEDNARSNILWKEVTTHFRHSFFKHVVNIWSILKCFIFWDRTELYNRCRSTDVSEGLIVSIFRVKRQGKPTGSK